MSCPYLLQSAVWEITLACCFSCKYCGSGGGRPRENELTTAECLDICHQLAQLGCQRVSLIGGEVFLRPDWNRIISELSSLDIRTAVITNGFLFTEQILRDLKESGAESVAVSLDGPKELHDRYRQTGSYDRAVSAIRALADTGIPVSVISTLNHETAAHLEEFYGILREFPLFAWQIQACSPMGNAANSGIDYRFSAAEVIRFVEKYKDSAPFSMGIADNIGYYTEGEDSLRGQAGHPFPGCCAGLSALSIDSVGNVRGCESLYDDRFIEGNLRSKSLQEIWENPDGFAYNRKYSRSLLSGACADCQFSWFCAGGCRSYNYFAHGKLYESPLCARTE